MKSDEEKKGFEGKSTEGILSAKITCPDPSPTKVGEYKKISCVKSCLSHTFYFN